MLKLRLIGLLLAALTGPGSAHAGIYADAVVDYDPGTGASPSQNNPAAALGEPARVTPGMFGGPVDPFSPPYLNSQVVSIGTGGWLTLQFDSPIRNAPENTFGLDFLVFGNAGFIITNAFNPDTFAFEGTPATDGSLFGAAAGPTRVLVSEDGIDFFLLDPARAPTVDGLFPTDGLGNFQQAVDPALTAASVAGATLDDLRALYNGAGGGAGYDLAWALDDQGRSADLQHARYVRIEVLGDKAEIDGLVMVPEPAAWLLGAVAAGAFAVGARFGRRPRPAAASRPTAS